MNAQSTSASLTGLIDDPQRAIIQDATVTAINTETGVKTSTTSNREGQYVLPNLQPGSYHLEVDHPGFKGIIEAGLTLHVQDVVQINFHMAVGSASETVSVSASDIQINKTDGSVSTVVDAEMIKNMPLNGRSFQDLILLTPGVVTQSPQIYSIAGVSTGLGRTGEFSVNGQRTESNYYTVDGVSANSGVAPTVQGGGVSGSVSGATALGTTQALVSVDELQEFRVQSSSYSAEYGRNPGGQFAFETKSGSNSWNGTAYDYLRNDYFDANDWFNDYLDVKEPALRQNDFGGTLGGPVRIPRLYDGRNKTFFFVSYEGLRLLQPQAAATINVPDASLRAATPAPLLQVLKAFPLPSAGGVDDVANGTAQFFGTWSNPSSINSTAVRFDDAINDKLKLFFRFGNAASQLNARGASGNAPTNVTRSDYLLRTYTAGVNSLIASGVSNEFRLNYTTNNVQAADVIGAFGGGTPVDLLQLTGLSGSGPSPAVSVVLGYDANSSLSEDRQVGSQRQWNLVDGMSVAAGRHQFKFGVDYRRLAPFVYPESPQIGYYYFSPNSVTANNADFAIPQIISAAYPLYTNFSAYGQDEWKLARRVILSLGIRWDVNPAPGVTQGLKPRTLQGTGPSDYVLAPQGTPLWQTKWTNLAPRLGAAYVARSTPGWETVVRAGAGVFFDTAQQLGSAGFNGPGFAAFNFLLGVPLAGNGPTLLPPVDSSPDLSTYNGYVYAFPTHLQSPFTLQWNGSVQQELGKSQSLTISFVGSHAEKLLKQNQVRGSGNNAGDTFVSYQNGLTSDYDSLQIQFQRRFSHGLSALAGYTWSHCLDYGSEDYSFGYQLGNCDSDVRHNFSAAFSYDLPNVGHGGFVNTVLHHWGLDDRITARTGFPVTLNGNTLPQQNGQVYHAGLDLVTGQPIYLYGSNCDQVLGPVSQGGLGRLPAGKGCPGGRAVNPLAFTNVSSGLGNAPRNFIRGFGAWQMDLAVRREFPVYESFKLQFRAEAFNTFNHPNFGSLASGCNGPAGHACSGQFGQFSGTLATSLGVLSPLYQMGGPRSMQFALKLVF